MKKDLYILCKTCTHTENTHDEDTKACRGYLCDCEKFVEKK